LKKTAPRYLVAHGRRLEYRWIAPRDRGKPPLVLLHEGLGSAELWRDFPDRLAARTGAGALVYSRYGYGRSDVLGAPRNIHYLEHEALTSLPAVLAALRIGSPVLIGHSDGASIALIHAADGRWPVRGLVLEAPHVLVEDVTLQGIAEARSAYESGTLRDRLRPWHTDVDATFNGWADVWLEPRFRAWNIERHLPGIRCPSLVIQGQDDRYGTLAQVEAIQRGNGGPVETLTLPDCGHAPHAERADEVLHAMAGFVATLSGSIPGSNHDAPERKGPAPQ
jgi:pimeloyl-ACP methyl ester carboxylesterase